jgi:hypothetical protein
MPKGDYFSKEIDVQANWDVETSFWCQHSLFSEPKENGKCKILEQWLAISVSLKSQIKTNNLKLTDLFFISKVSLSLKNLILINVSIDFLYLFQHRKHHRIFMVPYVLLENSPLADTYIQHPFFLSSPVPITPIA